MICALFVSVFTNTMVNVAIPLIREQFGISEAESGWVITGYALTFAVGIPLYGRVSDLFSLRRTFAFGVGMLSVGLAVCALAPPMTVLVAGRALQGVGAGAIPAVAFGSIAKLLAPGQRGTALGALSSSVGVGAAAGPVLGGLIAGAAGWQALFYVTLGLSLVVLAASIYVLPDRISDEPVEDATLRRLDLPGGLLLGGTAGFLLFGVTQAETMGLSSFLVWGCLLLAALAGASFAWHIRTTPEPFISPRIFASRSFLAAALVGFLAQFTNIGSLFLAPLLLEGTSGLSPAAAGLILAPGAVAVATLSPFAGRLSDRLGPRTVLLYGLTFMLVSTLVISSFAVGASPYVVAVGLLLLGVGYAGTNSPAANAASGAIPREVAGTGLGIYQLFFFLGSGAGPAVLGAFLASRRGVPGGAINPLYSLQATPFSDAFLLAALAVTLALLAATRLDGKPQEQVKE
jgi:DHA2 family metal-tetracycline-proton antiporter-like MFS transporter/DHA2 family florfenicol/chloramphenicol resistance protein-like MFS transporter